jgi:hypothetical protein
LPASASRRPLFFLSFTSLPTTPSPLQHLDKKNKTKTSIWRPSSVNRAACAHSCTRLRPPHFAPSAPAPMLSRPTCPTCRSLPDSAPSWARHWLSRALAPTPCFPALSVAREPTALALPALLVLTCTLPVLRRLRLSIAAP